MKRVGVLLKKDGQISHWQHRVLKGISNNKRIGLTFLLLDESSQDPWFKQEGNSFLAEKILAHQLKIERKLLGDRNNDFSIFDSTKTDLEGYPIHDISHYECSNTKKLEVILNLTNHFIGNDYKKISLNGVWNILFCDIQDKKMGPVGFWEVLEKREGVGASIIRRGEKDNANCIEIASCFFNRAWSVTETKKNVYEGSVAMILKELNFLVDSEVVDYSKSINILPVYHSIGLLSVVRYISRFYSQLFSKAWEKLLNKVVGIRPEKWSLFVGKGEFETNSLDKIKPVSMPKDEFWADPFLFQQNGLDYVFFENYSYRTKKGKISCGHLDGTALIDIKDVLIKDYHLSFPFIFREGSEIFLMPETSENKRLEIYKASNFPTSWELFATAFEGEMVADPFFHTDKEGQRWLFINKQLDELSPMNSELYIYRVNSVTLEEITPHKQNPVLIDSRVARNGGCIFEKGGIIYRPSQRNTDGIYGRALNINRIQKLSLDEYKEEVVATYYPTFEKDVMAMHHLHQSKNTFVFDAAYRNSLRIKH